MKKFSAGKIILSLLLCALLDATAALAQETAPQNVKATALQTGRAVERSIVGGETHVFQFELKKDEYARAEVRQKDVDLLVSVVDPDGKTVGEMYGSTNHLWRVPVSVVAAKGGTYRLQIKAEGTAAPGGYEVEVAEVRAAAPDDGRRVEAERALLEAIRLDRRNKPKEAAVFFERTRGLWRAGGEKYWEAVAVVNLGWTYFASDETDKALEAHGEALRLFQELKERRGVGNAANALGYAYMIRGDNAKARDHFEQALAIRRELRLVPGEAATLRGLRLVYNKLNQPERFLGDLEKMLAASRDARDRRREALALKTIGDVYFQLNRYVEVVRCYEQALPIARELKERDNEVYLLRILGLIYGQAGRYEKARDYLEQSIALKEALNDKSGTGQLYGELGVAYTALDEDEKALVYYGRALADARASQNREAESLVLSHMGSHYRKVEEYEKAIQHYEQGLLIARELKNQSMEANLLGGLGVLYSAMGQQEKALSYGEQALALKRQVKEKYSEAMALATVGLILNNLGRYEKAKEKFEQSLGIYREFKDRDGESGALGHLAMASSFLNQHERARDYYEQALKVAREVKNRRMEYSALNGLASAHSALSQFERAAGLYEESLKIAKELKGRRKEVYALISMGSAYSRLGLNDRAREHQERALVIAREVKDRYAEGVALSELGGVHFQVSQYAKAQDYYQQSLAIAREKKNKLGEYNAVLNLGFIHVHLSQYDKARDHLEQAKALNETIKLRSNEINLLLGFGAISADLNDYGKAANYYQQSLGILKEVKNRYGEGILLNSLGTNALNRKQYKTARKYFEQALAIAREVRSRPSEANPLINLGQVYLKLNQPARAREFYEQGLAAAREAKRALSEGYALNGLGELHQQLKQPDVAQDYYRRALVMSKELKSRQLEATAAWNLMKSLDGQGDARLSTFYGKQAVNAFQSIRGGLKGFDKDSQLSFVKDKEQAYRTLADILISDGRLHEAQVVLNFLKEEEYQGIVRSGETPDTVPYSRAEAETLKHVDALATMAVRRDELRKLQTERGKLSDDEQKELARLDIEEIPKANVAFRTALRTLKASEPNAALKIAEIENRGDLTGTLESLNASPDAGVVALYTVIGTEGGGGEEGAGRREKFGWVVLVTPTESKAYPIDVRDLEQTVFAYRAALSSDRYDPRPLAEKLYRKLFRQTSPRQKTTLEADLETLLGRYRDRTLMWSLDGVLLYVPMAALYDGKSYLVEKYRNVVFTQKSLTGLTRPDRRWRVLGLGVSEQRENFVALPGVKRELEEVVRQPNETTGILEGTRMLDGQFTKSETLRLWKDGAYSVVHIASHFSFNPLNPESSFLLLGDGRLTFGDINGHQGLFNALDLLTLSACDTATSSNGKEFESFAYLAQDLGARTVLASLWKVSDTGTPELMTRFYRLRAADPALPKGEAFRRAQLSLLRGGDESSTTGAAARTRGSELAARSNLRPFDRDARRPFAHPYYWSSFVLIGNWR
ncbi:MAG TPA: tetratricopeptide repeat protein [Pyrinomonadaceae bacterium]